MIHTQLQQRIQNLRSNSAGGFTMVEVVIAGVLLVSVMTSVAQMSVAALAGSKNLSSRAGIEAAVNNDIQLIQQADSYLTYQSIEDLGDQDDACQAPTSYLINYLETEVPAADVEGFNVSREITTGATDDVVQVSYQFQGPETGVGDEYRVIELNPNFSAQCYTTN
ncbi:MAG: hypothetical protein CL862_09970 [Cyanobium sp. NAT70]|nr:hypothetical protein [Cyanobium sp. NAT70]|tara:strand:+ start:423 stop:920 length:498 start_codon:yes stop_codon:yes gene_type:complete